MLAESMVIDLFKDPNFSSEFSVVLRDAEEVFKNVAEDIVISDLCKVFQNAKSRISGKTFGKKYISRVDIDVRKTHRRTVQYEVNGYRRRAEIADISLIVKVIYKGERIRETYSFIQLKRIYRNRVIIPYRQYFLMRYWPNFTYRGHKYVVNHLEKCSDAFSFFTFYPRNVLYYRDLEPWIIVVYNEKYRELRILYPLWSWYWYRIFLHLNTQTLSYSVGSLQQLIDETCSIIKSKLVHKEYKRALNLAKLEKLISDVMHPIPFSSIIVFSMLGYLGVHDENLRPVSYTHLTLPTN